MPSDCLWEDLWVVVAAEEVVVTDCGARAFHANASAWMRSLRVHLLSATSSSKCDTGRDLSWSQSPPQPENWKMEL